MSDRTEGGYTPEDMGADKDVQIVKRTYTASELAARVAEAYENAADAAAQDAQIIVTSLGNIETEMAADAPESFCAKVSRDYERAIKAALNLPKRIRAIAEADRLRLAANRGERHGRRGTRTE